MIPDGSGPIICGDVNRDGVVNISDAVALINYIFIPDPPIEIDCRADANGDGAINISDAVYIVNYVFVGGPPPVEGCCDFGYPSGQKISDTGCKSFGKDGSDPFYDCINWSYDGFGTLTLTHINTAFNCCPAAVWGNFSFPGNDIVIEEDESYDPEAGPCPCLCLFDIEYEFYNIAPDEYDIVVYGMHVWPPEPIQFTVNFATEPTGSYCIYRDYYPWGNT